MSEIHTQQQKSAAVAYLLWFFLGCFGGHRFYFGKTGSAIGMLGLNIGSVVLSVVVIGLIGFPILFGWWIVDAFLIGKWLQADAASQGTPGTIGAPSTPGAVGAETTPDTVGSIGSDTNDESVSDAA